MTLLTPYAIDGAQHSARLFRRQLQQASSGAAGISRPGDFKVLPLNVPGAGFRVSAGGVLIPSRDSGVAYRETYGVENDGEISVLDVPGTGSSGGRTDMVIVEVTDPSMQAVSYPVPDEPLTAAYSRVRVVQNVPANAKSIADVPALANVTGYACALIKWPASTGTITAAMITDLREVALPRSIRVLRNINLTEKGTGDRQHINVGGAYPLGGDTWPQEAENAGILDIEIPAWATHMAYTLSWTQLNRRGGTGNAYGQMWLQVGAHVDPDVWRGQNSQWDMDENAATHNTSMFVSDTAKIPTALRGKIKRFYPRASLLVGAAVASPACYWASSFSLDVTFEERSV